MAWVMLSGEGLLSVPKPASQEGQGARRDQSHDSWCELAPGIFQTISQGVVSNSTVNDLSLLTFIYLFIFFFSVVSFSIKIIIIIFYSEDVSLLLYFNY